MLSSNGTFGEYKYFGLEKCLNVQIDLNVFTDEQIKLLIHIDGAELFNKTKKHAWTILG